MDVHQNIIQDIDIKITFEKRINIKKRKNSELLRKNGILNIIINTKSINLWKKLKFI